MKLIQSVGRGEFSQMGTADLRSHFLLPSPFVPDAVTLEHWETDRTIIGGAMPVNQSITLHTPAELRAECFCQRREIGVLNLGGNGHILIDTVSYELPPYGALYIGRGSRSIEFTSINPAIPAKFFLISYPAHQAYPTIAIPQEKANQVALGESKTANVRTIYQYIHENGVKSCQLVMGFTQLSAGNVWNTMPPHTHLRRSEVYHYFNVPEEAAVSHFMGPGDETRHLWVGNHGTVLSPPWSIHSGCGTQSYAFIWAMGGENQEFQDMDRVNASELK